MKPELNNEGGKSYVYLLLFGLLLVLFFFHSKNGRYDFKEGGIIIDTRTGALYKPSREMFMSDEKTKPILISEPID